MRFMTFFFAILALFLHVRMVSSKTGRLWIYKRRDFPPPGYRDETRLAEPQIQSDIDDALPRPTHYDQVFTAIYDALQLIEVVMEKIEDDETIFPHYFDPRRENKLKVAQIFSTLAGHCETGSHDLAKVKIQITDVHNGCEATKGVLPFAYSFDGETQSPTIVLCPALFHKKAYTLLNGVPGNPEQLPEHYLRCNEVAGGAEGRVSWRMESMGSVLLHEYMHLDFMLKSVLGRSIDDERGSNGHTMYGAEGVYDSPDRNLLGRTNADSYVYYALQVFWEEICGFQFSAPQPGDSQDPDGMISPPIRREVANASLAVRQGKRGGWWEVTW
ncbi:MAG: hypothetical protein Q9218_004844 [Villophora microphyllina]